MITLSSITSHNYYSTYFKNQHTHILLKPQSTTSAIHTPTPNYLTSQITTAPFPPERFKQFNKRQLSIKPCPQRIIE